MALSFPLALDEFADLLQIKKSVFIPSQGREFSGQGTGRIRVKNLRPMLWLAQVTLVPLCRDQADPIMALLEQIENRDGTFYLYDPRRKFPIAGEIDDAGVQIRTLGSDGISLSLKHAPIGHHVMTGDMLAYSYGGDSVVEPSRALHRVIGSAIVDGSHNTAEFEVMPALPIGVETSTPVALVKPAAQMMLLPGSLAREPQDTQFDVISFQAQQVT